jgi:pentatricopeptide repeat protein
VSLASRVLLLIIAAEALVGGLLAARRLRRPVPPQADWALLDPATAGQIRSAAAACESADDWRNLAELYMAAGCFAESESCHRIACELAPGNALFARQWGFALERLSLLDEANAQYRRAIDLGTPDPDACRYFIARNHLRAENPAEAGRVFTEGRALDANRYELARLHRRDGELAPAEDLLRSVANVRPRALQVHLLGYRLARDRGDARQAFVCGDRARYAPDKLPNPFDEEAERIIQATEYLGPNRHWKRGRELIEGGQLDEAEAVLDEAGQVYRSPAVVELLAEVAVRRGRFDEALRLFEEFQEQGGPSARIVARMGDVWDAAGDPAKARASWLRAVRLGAGLDLKATHQKLAVSFADAGDQPAADRHLALVHYFTGRELLQLGRPDQAVAPFAAAVDRDPALAQAWFYLGESRRLTGQTEPAAAAYRACLRLNPDHGRALDALAFLGVDAGK